MRSNHSVQQRQLRQQAADPTKKVFIAILARAFALEAEVSKERPRKK
jgi:hypothetical protein